MYKRQDGARGPELGPACHVGRLPQHGDCAADHVGKGEDVYKRQQQEGDRLVDAWLTNPDTDSAIVPASALTGLEEAVRADLAGGVEQGVQDVYKRQI